MTVAGAVAKPYKEEIMEQITLILLNLRFSDFYSPELFKLVKEQYQARIVAILDQNFVGRVGDHISPYLDKIYTLDAQTKDGFLAEFDFEQLCQIIETEMRFSRDVKIVCTDEFNLLHAGHLRRRYHLFGNTDLDMVAFRDKAKMKHILQDAGIRVPRFKLFQRNDDFAHLSESIGLPFVIKPVDSSGSFGVYIVRTQADYLQAATEISRATAQFEVEEYIDGKLYHVDSCTQNGKVTFICANEYTYPNYEYTKGKTLGSIPVDVISDLGRSLVNFSQQALRALGSKDLINHMEVFINNKQELIFLEVSARPPGAMVNLVHKVNYAINLLDLDFKMQTGLQFELPKLEKNEHAFWAMFPLVPGKINSYRTPMVKSRVEIQYFRDKGTTILPEESNGIVGKMAHAIFYHHDKAILRNDFEYIREFNLAEMNFL